LFPAIGNISLAAKMINIGKLSKQFNCQIITQTLGKNEILIDILLIIGTYINITGKVVEDICLQDDLLSSDNRIW